MVLRSGDQMMMENLKGLGMDDEEEDCAEEEIEKFIFNQETFGPEGERNNKAKINKPRVDGL